MTVTLKHSLTQEIKIVKIDFSWTSLFFGFLTPLFRKDFRFWFFALLSSLQLIFYPIMGFYYNESYLKHLLEEGFLPSEDSDKAKLIERRFLDSPDMNFDKIRKNEKTVILKGQQGVLYPVSLGVNLFILLGGFYPVPLLRRDYSCLSFLFITINALAILFISIHFNRVLTGLILYLFVVMIAFSHNKVHVKRRLSKGFMPYSKQDEDLLRKFNLYKS